MPPRRSHFANRHHELSSLDHLRRYIDDEGPPLLVVISGPAGVGKTSLGLRWLHRIRSDFADGQLFVDLQGFSGDQPVPPSEPLERFLRALGVAPEKIPVDMADQVSLYRSLTAGRRLLIMLDNAATAAQVQPLVPGYGPAVVVVTTRWRLTGLAMTDASFVPVEPLDEAGSIQLLERMLGADRTAAEPDKARSLAVLCGGLPLALCTSAARLAVRARWPIGRVVQELADERSRLAVLSAEADISVQAVLDVSYQGLPPETARVYRLLGLHPGADFDVAATAALAGVGDAAAAAALDALVGANLLEEDDAGRYRFHDLVRLHARSTAERTDSGEERAAAFTRLTDHYLATAVAADLTLIPGRWHLGGHYAAEPRVAFAGTAAATEWLESELGNLTAVLKAAADQAAHDAVWQLCEALWGLFVFRKHYRIWVETHELGLASARARGNARAQARMLVALATADLNLRDFAAATARGREALRLVQGTDHWRDQAAVLEALGIARLGAREPEHAVGFFDRALAINERIGERRGVAMMTRRLGAAYERLGRFEEAAEQLTRACRTFADLGDRYNEARTLAGLGDARLAQGRPDEARTALESALELTLAVGAEHEQANVHVALARLAEGRADPDAERSHLEHAHALYERLGAPQVREISQRLAGMSPAPGADASDDPPGPPPPAG